LSAVNLTGSPFHTRLQGLDNASVGNQDRALALNAAIFPFTLQVNKVANGAPAPSAGFQFGITTKGSIGTLTNPLSLCGNNPCSANSGSVFPAAGNTTYPSYQIAETLPPGWNSARWPAACELAIPAIACPVARELRSRTDPLSAPGSVASLGAVSSRLKALSVEVCGIRSADQCAPLPQELLRFLRIQPVWDIAEVHDAKRVAGQKSGFAKNADASVLIESQAALSPGHYHEKRFGL